MAWPRAAAAPLWQPSLRVLPKRPSVLMSGFRKGAVSGVPTFDRNFPLVFVHFGCNVNYTRSSEHAKAHSAYQHANAKPKGALWLDLFAWLHVAVRGVAAAVMTMVVVHDVTCVRYSKMTKCRCVYYLLLFGMFEEAVKAAALGWQESIEEKGSEASDAFDARINAMVLGTREGTGSAGGSRRSQGPKAVVRRLDSTTYTSSFESDFDGWTTSTFLRDASGTYSSSTGPTSAYDGSYYVYAETSSPNYPGVEFSMYRDFGDGVASVSFQYSMYGRTMGTALLQGSDDGGLTYSTLWSKSGNQGDAWYGGGVSIGSGYPQWLKFVYTSGSSYTGDFALDEVKVVAGSWPSPQPTASPVPTSSPNPSPVPTPSPTRVPNPAPSLVPNPAPSPVPSSLPTLSQVPTTTAGPTPVPLPLPTTPPSPVPSPLPTLVPSPLPTSLPTSTTSVSWGSRRYSGTIPTEFGKLTKLTSMNLYK